MNVVFAFLLFTNLKEEKLETEKVHLWYPGSHGGQLLWFAAAVGGQRSGLDGAVPGAARSGPADGGVGATVRPRLRSYGRCYAAADLRHLCPSRHELIARTTLHPGPPGLRQDPDPGWVHQVFSLSSFRNTVFITWPVMSLCPLSSGHVERHGKDAGVWAAGCARRIRPSRPPPEPGRPRPIQGELQLTESSFNPSGHLVSEYNLCWSWYQYHFFEPGTSKSTPIS